VTDVLLVDHDLHEEGEQREQEVVCEPNPEDDPRVQPLASRRMSLTFLFIDSVKAFV
jgi:hypothetical protein